MPRALLLGATGGCGRHALARMLASGVATTVIVRDASRLPASVARDHPLLTIVVAPRGHLRMAEDEFLEHVRGVDAVVSCLGHTMSLKGVCGCEARRLCADTCRDVCDAARALAPDTPIKLVVISTEGVDRPDGGDDVRKLRGCAERLVLGLLWCLLPPHADNMDVVKVLHANVTRANCNPHVEFCAVRPSDLHDADAPTACAAHDALRNGIFNPGSTSRVNVGNFLADLVVKPELWARWKGGYPHLLDAVSGAEEQDVILEEKSKTQ